MRRAVPSLLALLACLAASSGVFASACSGAVVSSSPTDGGLADTSTTNEASDEGGIGTPVGPTEPLTIFGTYAVTKLYLGETNRSDQVIKDAWKEYGENLDGLVSTRSDPGPNHCRRFAGADSAKHEDGLLGIDNAWGRTILSFILGLVPTPSKTTNEQLAKGSRAFAVSLLPPAGGTPARAGFLTLAQTTSPLKLDGTDVRSASPSSVAGTPDSPNAISSSPKMGGRLVASGVAAGTYVFEMPLSGDTWRIPLRFARVTMTISTDGTTASTGTLSGIVQTEELVNELTKVAGRISTQLCSGSTLDTIKTTIRQASDILSDGTQDAARACDAISFGIGFDAVKVSVAGTTPDPAPTPDPCN